jgi:hypothetical protein
LDKELILEMIDYIEGMTVQHDAEYGAIRKFKEILEDDYDEVIPELYFKLKKLLDE